MTKLVIEVPDEGSAESLRHALGSVEVESVVVDGRAELHVTLWHHNPESKVVEILNGIDAWLVQERVPSVRVALDGTVYTLHAPPAR